MHSFDPPQHTRLSFYHIKSNRYIIDWITIFLAFFFNCVSCVAYIFYFASNVHRYIIYIVDKDNTSVKSFFMPHPNSGKPIEYLLLEVLPLQLPLYLAAHMQAVFLFKFKQSIISTCITVHAGNVIIPCCCCTTHGVETSCTFTVSFHFYSFFFSILFYSLTTLAQNAVVFTKLKRLHRILRNIVW